MRKRPFVPHVAPGVAGLRRPDGDFCRLRSQAGSAAPPLVSPDALENALGLLPVMLLLVFRRAETVSLQTGQQRQGCAAPEARPLFAPSAGGR